MKYRWHISPAYKKRNQKYFKAAGVGFLAVIILLTAFLLYEQINKIDYNPDDQTTSSAQTTTISAKDQLFESPYFQFRADKSWAKDEKSSNENMYVYRSIRSGLLNQLLTIYVNQSPDDLEVTRVLPVTQEGVRLNVRAVSEHCGKQSNFNKQLSPITIDSVTINCFGDDTRYNVLVGLVGGTSQMKLLRPDNTTAVYTIHYTNSTSTPDAAQLQDIVNSFKVR